MSGELAPVALTVVMMRLLAQARNPYSGFAHFAHAPGKTPCYELMRGLKGSDAGTPIGRSRFAYQCKPVTFLG